MKSVNTERLLRLADHLEKDVPEAEFNMETWGVREPACGTTCCAFGHACNISEFAEAGLRIVWKKLDVTTFATVWFDGADGIDAAIKFFDISSYAANDLFAPNYEGDLNNETPVDIAERIREFVSKQTAAGVAS
jgi:hypothetical protein